MIRLRPAEPKPKSNSAVGTDLSGHLVYACGAPVVVEAARRDFAAAGLPEHEFYADAFTSERDKLGA